MGFIDTLKETWNPSDTSEGPSWETRLQEAAYTSPSGNRLTFDFEDVSTTWDKKTSAFEFADVDGTLVQDHGHGGRKYPLRIIFHGLDHDFEAAGFETLLEEKGRGVLEHPLYGRKDVVPFGAIGRRDDLKSAANQTIFEVTFWSTLRATYPTGDEDFGSSVTDALAAFNAAAGAQMLRELNLSGAADENTFKNRVLAGVGAVEDGLGKLAATTEAVGNQFDAIVDSINRGIDILVRDPLTLAFQTKLLIQAPGRAASALSARLDAYAKLAADIFGAADAVTTDGNLFYTRGMFAGGYVSGSVVSVVNTDLETRADAIGAADELLDQLDALTAWRDLNYRELGEIDTGEAYQALLDAVSLAAGYLVEISFTLKQERSIVLDRARSIVDLAAELLGSTWESRLDFFINSNALTGSEIFELPKGRTVRYYV